MLNVWSIDSPIESYDDFKISMSTACANAISDLNMIKQLSQQENDKLKTSEFGALQSKKIVCSVYVTNFFSQLSESIDTMLSQLDVLNNSLRDDIY